MGKYNIDKELKHFRNFNAPINKFIIAFCSFFAYLLPKGFDKKKVKVEFKKLGNIKYHIVTPIGLENKKTPVMFYLHGGGFIFREAFVQYMLEQEYALRCNMRVIGVDYDISPWAPYPIAINECFEVYKYLNFCAEELNIDTDNIVICGDSAGGSLANDVYFKILEENQKEPKCLLLIYPVVDNLQNSDSMKKYTDTTMWNSKANKKMWKYYLQGQEYKSPLLKLDLYKVQNVFIELTEFDCLHDEGMALYKGLEGKVKNLVLNDTKGTFHAYDGNKDAKVTIDAVNRRIEFLNDVLINKK
ncbi:MAG: alpha/beta hydrolase [Clostridia bacterium]|nr:alpha/beta hydrolase [Clostridia bacterium]